MAFVKDLVIHVGFRKTATTWMQDILFPKLDLNYIGKTSSLYPKWLINWHYADDFYFDQKKEEIHDKLISVLKKDRCNLLSSEAFTNTASIYSQAYRIKSIYPDSRILVTLRDPVEMVFSHYRDDINEGDCHVNIEDWIDWKRTPYVLNKRKAIYLPDFFFNESINLYEKIFGQENVCILKIEDMHRKRDIFFSNLFNFLGIYDEIPGVDLLKERVNVSIKNKEDLEKIKIFNFKQYAKKYFAGITISTLYPQISNNSNEKISDKKELQKKLAKYYKGKSYGYY